MQNHFTYADLVNRCGEIIAWNYLSEIEKASYKKPFSLSVIDPEIRLANALRAQDAGLHLVEAAQGDIMAQGVITYKDMVARYGKNLAFDFLITVERIAKVQNSLVCLDEEIRWANALEALDKKL